MGHNQSHHACAKHSSLTDLKEFLLSQGHLLKQLASLKYSEFVQAVENLNTVCNSLSNTRGKYLVFSIVPGTDCTTILWKNRVRIECKKMMSDNDQCESTRVMTLKQFVPVYDSIMQQCHSIEARASLEAASQEDSRQTEESDSQEDGCSSSNSAERTRTDSQSNSRNSAGMADQWLEISTIFATVEQVSLESIDDGDCCICMEKKSDIALSCTHTYCQMCIDGWRKVHNTCPMCMDDIGTGKEVWAFPEKPNADEMTAYLMSITESRDRGGRTEEQRLEEWERLSYEEQ